MAQILSFLLYSARLSCLGGKSLEPIRISNVTDSCFLGASSNISHFCRPFRLMITFRPFTRCSVPRVLSVVSKPVLVEIKRTSKCFRLETPHAYEIRERHEYMNKYKLWKDIGQFSIKWRKRMSRHMSGEKSSPLITLMGSNAAGQI